MVFQYILFALELILLFFLSRSFTDNFFRLFFLLTKSKIISLWITTVFLLPGTIIHELSHWLVSEILQVPTGRFSFTPTILPNGTVKMASVEIGMVDPFRRTLIGLAPFFSGLLFIILLSRFIPYPWLSSDQLLLKGIILLGMFIITNTMFSSPKDLEAAFVPFFLIGVLILMIWYFQVSIPTAVLFETEKIFTLLTQIFPFIIGLNLFIIGTVKILTFWSERLLHRRLVRR